MEDYQGVGADLRTAYRDKVAERDAMTLQPWKLTSREKVLAAIQAEQKTQLLEIGAGTGIYGKYFLDAGLDVVSTDMSEDMVAACQAKGLKAFQRDFLDLGFSDDSFDVVFAMNCLLHVPQADLPAALSEIARVVKPGGLFFWGQYGGTTFAGTMEDDHYEPKRYFSLLSDDEMKAYGEAEFVLEDFYKVPLDHDLEDFQHSLWRN